MSLKNSIGRHRLITLYVQVIQAKLEEAESDIAEAKTELEAARLVRRNRMEYDSMAKSIAAFPSRY